MRQYLDRNIIGNQVLFDQGTQKSIFGLGCGREPDLDFFKTQFHKHLEKLQLLLQVHRHDESLITITKIDTAPSWSFCDVLLLRPFQASLRRHKITSCVLFRIFHVNDRLPIVFVLLIYNLFVFGI
ncbi:hypothetical protein D3C77_389940 [compost metagenome]